MGSGLATFSRYPIEQVFFKRFSLNGEPHRIFHGDWFSGKGVGACRIRLPDGGPTLDFYNTHLHAEYDCHTNFYMVHRMCQLQELVQFVELSSRSENLVMVVGDLNTIPGSFPYELLFKSHALSQVSPLVDSWQAVNNTKLTGRIMKRAKSEGPIDAVEVAGYTFNLPQNSFHTDGPIEKLDYVLVAKRHGLEVLDAGVLVDDKVLGSDVSLSDHSLVWTKIMYDPTISDSDHPALDNVSVQEKVSVAREAVKVIQAEIRRVNEAIHFCHVLAGALFALFLGLFASVLVTFIIEVLSTGVLFGLFCLQPILLTAGVLVLFLARVALQEQIASLVAFKREWNLFILSHDQLEKSRSDKISRVDVE